MLSFLCSLLELSGSLNFSLYYPFFADGEENTKMKILLIIMHLNEFALNFYFLELLNSNGAKVKVCLLQCNNCVINAQA